MTAPEALARRAVAAPGWRWLPGMLQTRGVERHRVELTFHVSLPGFDDPWLPDLTDDATRGVLLGLVRAAYADPGIHCTFDDHNWWARDGEGTYLCARPGAREKRQNGERCCVGGPCHGPAAAETEGGALVLALEAAPVRP